MTERSNHKIRTEGELMKFHYDRFSQNFFLFLVVIEVVFLGFLWVSKHQDISFQYDSIETLNSDWTTYDHNDIPMNVELPVTIDGQGDYIRVSHILPEFIPRNWVIATLSSGTLFQVYLEDEVIYSFHDNSKLPFELAPGSMWNIVSLPDDAGGKLLTIEVSPEPHHTRGTIHEIYLGTKAAFLLQTINTKGLDLFVAFVVLLISVNLILVYLSMLRYFKNNRPILYLGLFSLFVSLWMLMESDAMQFLLDNRYFISTIKYLSLMTLPIPILFYISLVDGYRYKKQVLLFNSLFIINLCVMFSLQLMGIMTFHDGLPVLHILMAVVFTLVLIQLCVEVFVHDNRSLRYFTLSFGILFVFSMLEILTYNLKADFDTGSFLQFGVLFFLIILSFNSLKRASEIVRLSETAKQYEYLATRDYMTKCKNRNAYIKELDQIEHSQRTTIILADINNTKYINDTYGHHAGDFVIVQCSQCLLDILESDEYCYRIGGDEFVCIEYDISEEMIKEKIKAFFKRCEEVNAECPYPFEVSIGYAVYDKTQDHSIHDTVKRADKDMYHRKNTMKFNSIS